MNLNITHNDIDYEFQTTEIDDDYIDGNFMIRTGSKYLDFYFVDDKLNAELLEECQDKLYQMELEEIKSAKEDYDLQNRLDNIFYEENREC